MDCQMNAETATDGQHSAATQEHSGSKEQGVEPQRMQELPVDVDIAMPRTPYEIPKQLVVFKPKTEHQLYFDLHYYADEQDLEWIPSMNEEAREGNGSFLSADDFELAIDRMEKESFVTDMEEVAANELPSDPAVCSVCGDDEACDLNRIVFCDLCNVSVHQDCYGVPYLPEGQWLCQRCEMSSSEPVPCELCPSRSGAFKRTTDHKWAHTMCGLWLTEISFEKPELNDWMKDVDECLKLRKGLLCLVCHRKVGACVQCAKRSCCRAYHVTCARAAGMQLDVLITDPEGHGKSTAEYVSYCPVHSGNTFGNSDGATTSAKRRKAQWRTALEAARKQLDVNVVTARVSPSPNVRPDKLESIRTGLNLDWEMMRRIYCYWILKREARCGAPLLTSPELSMKLCKRHDLWQCQECHADINYRWWILRRQLERLRLLLELSVKRERIKMEYLDQTGWAAKRCTKPINVIMDTVITKLVARDRLNKFFNPMNEEDMPNSIVIQNPMDLSTIHRRMVEGKYGRLDELSSDLMLMVKSYRRYLRNIGDPVKTYAYRTRHYVIKFLREAERMASYTKLVDQDTLNVFDVFLERFYLWENSQRHALSEKRRMTTACDSRSVKRPRTDEEAEGSTGSTL